MSDFSPKQGDMILARKISGRGMSLWFEVRFLCTEGLLFWGIKDGEHIAIVLDLIKPLPSEPEPVPFSDETWPKQVVWIRSDSCSLSQTAMVTGMSLLGVFVGRVFLSFKALSEEGKMMSLDFCQTWQPCHYVPES